MKPNIERAKKLLEEAVECYYDPQLEKDLRVVISQVLGVLRGYELPKTVLDRYRCSHCGKSGVKLWRGWGDDSEAWCSACATAQAGLEDTVDDAGRIDASCGLSDQIFSPSQGQCLMPWVPRDDGMTWGYTSVPPEGCEWWRSLPTRKEA